MKHYSAERLLEALMELERPLHYDFRKLPHKIIAKRSEEGWFLVLTTRYSKYERWRDPSPTRRAAFGAFFQNEVWHRHITLESLQEARKLLAQQGRVLESLQSRQEEAVTAEEIE